MIDLRDYQMRAVERLKESVEDALRSSNNEVVIFKSPTGSGKTVMVSDLLKRIVKDRKDDKKFSFVWIAVRKLHEQSKEKLEKYYEDDRLLQCSYFEDLEDKKIGENEILFINWHSINKRDINIYVRENEQDNNLNAIIKNTKEEDREIILIIDESHHTARSDKSIELIVKDILPSVTLEVSATPHLRENVHSQISVNLNDVKAEEMIKSEISINPEFMTVKVGSKDSDTLVIEQALKKREELKELYKKENVDINPLILIQLPDKKGDLINKKEEVLKILRNKDLKEDNGKLAVWLSEKDSKINLENIEKLDNEVEVLLFKQAIALGWDCPRASILVIFRESRSFTFTIQTIGRIMRMPELKYHNSEELNKGFIFTNLPNIEITEDYAKDYLTIYESKRDNKRYKEISLPSIYLKRQRERTRLSGKFADIFMKTAEELGLDKKINFKPSKIVSPIIADGKIVNIDQTGEVKGSHIDIKLNELELQQNFDRFVYYNCFPYAPADSSDRMKTAIYQFLNKKFKIKKFDPQAQKIVLGKENVRAFTEAIYLSKEKYKEEVVEKVSETREKIEYPKWEVPFIDSYKSNVKRESHLKSIMKPFYTRKPSQPEQLFMESLDKSNEVEWWYKNGEGEKKYFAVYYKDENNNDKAFYVDFIIKFKDGKIRLFDTKSWITAKDAGSRAEGLYKYIQKNKRKKIIGGIIIPIKSGEQIIWKYNDNKKYGYNPKDLSKWKILEI